MAWRLLALAALAAAGCGPSADAVREKHFKKLAAYTPELVADELADRVATLRRAPPAGAEPSGKDVPEQGKDAAMAAEAAKGAPEAKGPAGSGKSGGPFSFDGIIAAAASQARSIEGKPPAETFAAIAGRVDASAALTPADKAAVRKALAAALGLGG